MQQQSESVKNQYKSNISNLSGVLTQQDEIISELDLIEGELDQKLQQYENDQDYNRGLQSFGQEEVSLQEVPLRDRVLQNTKLIDTEIDNLNSKLQGAQQEIDHIKQKGNINSSSQAMKYSLQTQSNMKDMESVEKILGSYYQSLKWIQGTAIDLQFQTQEIEQKIQNANRN